jgi:hypothetical protein
MAGKYHFLRGFYHAGGERLEIDGRGPIMCRF